MTKKPAWQRPHKARKQDERIADLRAAIQYAVSPTFPAPNDDAARMSWLRAWWGGEQMRAPATTSAELDDLQKRARNVCLFTDWQEAVAVAHEADLALTQMAAALRTFVAHYPMGLNPFLDQAFRDARKYLAAPDSPSPGLGANRGLNIDYSIPVPPSLDEAMSAAGLPTSKSSPGLRDAVIEECAKVASDVYEGTPNAQFGDRIAGEIRRRAGSPAPPSPGQDWVVRKGGYFYRPHARGYTVSILEAGRYTREDAEAHAAASSGEVTAHPASEFFAARTVAEEPPPAKEDSQ